MKKTKTSIRTKITVFFLVACVIPITAFLLSLSAVFIREANNLIRQNMQITKNDLNSQIKSRTDSIGTLFDLLYVNDMLLSIIGQSIDHDGHVPYSDEITLRETISGILYTIPIQGIDRILFIDADQHILTLYNIGDSSLLLDDLPIADFIAMAESKPGGVVYSNAYTITNTLRQTEIIHGTSRTVRNINISRSDPFKKIGTFVMVLNSEFFLLNRDLSDPDIRIALFDDASRLVLATDPEDFASVHKIGDQLRQFIESQSDITIQTDGFIMGSGAVSGFGYQVVYYKTISGILGNLPVSIAIVLAILVLFCIVLLVFLYRLLRQTIVRPLGLLSGGIARLSEGDLSVRITPVSNDELGRITTGFNKMAGDIQENIKTMLAMESQLRLEEIRYLQAQLNPHFLFNTLSMARLMAMNQQSADTPVILQRLTRLLKAIINEMGQEIPLEQELANLEDYIRIQTIKYPNRFDIEIHLAEDTKTCLIPALTLQPLLENSILHGILPLKSRGMIRIAARTTGGKLIITVEDNGAGMTKEQIDELYQTDPLDSHKSIGYYNVNRILQLRYGNEYGLTAESESKSFTRITATLPARYPDQNQIIK